MSKKKVTEPVYNDYLQFFIENLEFAKQYISVHYPFNYFYLIDNWDFLELGSGHYSVYIDDIESIFTSKIGLTYNKNIRWNSKLRAKFDYGFEDPYLGYFVGTGKGPVEADEREYLDEIIPLDIKKEIFERDEISFLKSGYIGLADEGLDLRELFREIKNLTFPEFQEIFKKEGSFTCLINESIWENTLHYVIDESFCHEIIARVKKN